jgi:hypothetical protein
MISVATNMNAVIAAELQKISSFDALAICKRQATDTVSALPEEVQALLLKKE